MSIRLAIKDEVVYMIEAKPRASRTAPYRCAVAEAALAA